MNDSVSPQSVKECLFLIVIVMFIAFLLDLSQGYYSFGRGICYLICLLVPIVLLKSFPKENEEIKYILITSENEWILWAMLFVSLFLITIIIIFLQDILDILNEFFKIVEVYFNGF